jgi:uncharacterized protein
MRKGEWKQTATGRQFWPLDPRPNEVFIEDIAHALAMQCRFGGHCLRFYSVAEHSVLLCDAAPREHKLWALLHDAAEAYVVDVPRPLKRSLPGYKEIEANVMRAICVRFNLHLDTPPVIKDLDCRILRDEQLQNMAPPPAPWDGAGEPLGIGLQFWNPERARAEFLAEFDRLTGMQR